MAHRAYMHTLQDRGGRHQPRKGGASCELKRRSPTMILVEPNSAATSGPSLLFNVSYLVLLSTTPPFITKSTFCKIVMSFSGSPGTATMSASLPTSILPIGSARVSSERNLHARFHRPPKRIFVDLRHLQPHRRAFIRPSLRHVHANVNRRHIIHAPRCYRLQVFIRDVVAVLDSVHAGLDRRVHSIQRHRMR